MRLLLLADGEVGERTLSYLLENYRSDLALVVATEGNGVSSRAMAAGLRTVIFRDSAQIVQFSTENDLHFDLGVLAWWPKIIQGTLIRLPTHGVINFHPSLLPHNRGKHYNFWALVEEAPFGVSLHFVEEGIDCGAIVAQAPIGYGWEDTGETLYRKAKDAMVRLFEESYPSLRTLEIPRREQDLLRGSFHYAREIDAASCVRLDAMYRARDLLNLLRARTFPGHPACWFEDASKTYEVRVSIREMRGNQ